VTVTGCTKGKKEQQSLDSSQTETDSNQTEEMLKYSSN
jgi:hypothetical protein